MCEDNEVQEKSSECKHKRTYIGSDMREYCSKCGESWWAKEEDLEEIV
jgi:hypothetical protein